MNTTHDQIPVHVGIGEHFAGYVTWNQDDGTYLVLRRCIEVWNGYEVGIYNLPDGTVENIDESEDYDVDAAAANAARLIPDWDIISGMNDTDEGGYVVAAEPDSSIVIPLTDVTFEQIKKAIEDSQSQQTAAWHLTEAAITDVDHGWKKLNGSYSANPFWGTCDAVIEIDLNNNPDLAGWGYPDRDQ